MRRGVILICSFLVGSFVFGANAKSAFAEDDLTDIKTEFCRAVKRFNNGTS